MIYPINVPLLINLKGKLTMKHFVWKSVAVLTLATLTAGASETPQTEKRPLQVQMMQGKQKGKMKKRMHSPFLIKRGLPHMTKIVARYWNDPGLALQTAQKEKLMEIRKETMSGIKQLKPQVMALTQKIIKANRTGIAAEKQKERVEKLASLQAKATMLQLQCIEKTKAVLSPEQMNYLKQKRKAGRLQQNPNRPK